MEATQTKTQEQGSGNPPPPNPPPPRRSFEDRLGESVTSLTSALGNVRSLRTGVNSAEEQVRQADRALVAAEQARQGAVESERKAKGELDQTVGDLIALLQDFRSSL